MAVCTHAIGAPQGYLGEVSQALDALAAGDTNASLAAIKRAFDLNANNSLGHSVLGMTLLMAGRPEDAAAEFASAEEMDPGRAEAIYGGGLVKLAKGQLGPAATELCRAQAANPNLGIASTIEYVKLMAGGSSRSAGGADDAGLAIKAWSLVKQGSKADAAPIWRELLPSVTRPSFGQPIGCSMTFVPKTPLALTGWGLKERYKPLSSAQAKLQSVSGNVALRADLSRARDVRLVAFHVDGQLVGMTNQPPFQYSWDTTRYENGVHTVKISGADSGGCTVTEKTSRVLVRNTSGKRARKPDSAEEAKLWARLWDVMRIRPSASAVNYNLALCSADLGDREAETAALERVVAADPDYLDAAARLAALNRESGAVYARVFGGDKQGSKIALTFDDGPRPETGALLDVLKTRGVTATFFVVGKQAEAYPEVLKRIRADGHQIENHTYGHRALGYLSERDIAQEYFRTAAVVRSIVGVGTTAIRLPGGRTGPVVDEFAKRFGVKVVFWSASCVSLEGTTPERMLKYAIGAAKPGGMILMHNWDPVTVKALPGIIDSLRSKGYRFVSLAELIGQEVKK